jgi:hypothetical protein
MVAERKTLEGRAMKTLAALTGAVALAALAVTTAGAAAETDLEKAINAGADRLTADQIAARLVGKTVTATAGEKRFLFYYSNDNVLSGKLIGGKWSGSGYYGITDDDRVCVSMGQDKGRLRCMALLAQNGTVKKFNTAGKMTFELHKFDDGKMF